MRKLNQYSFFIVLFCLPVCAFAQSNKFIVAGSSKQIRCDCYNITPEEKYAVGGAWKEDKIDLNQPFDLSFKLFFGCDDNLGGDGSAFVLQPTTKLGLDREGAGFGDLNPSLGVSFDTWENSHLNDPAFDHIAIQKNGVIKHGSDLAGPIAISAASNNVEDCNWHKFRVTWDPTTKWLKTYFDGVARVAAQVDLVNDVFQGTSMVYWGFTGATGGAFNKQEFCTLTEPLFNVNLTNNGTCVDKPLVFKNGSQSFFPVAEYYWDWGDGTASREQNPEPKLYSTPGKYTVKMSMTDVTGCVSNEYVKDIVVGVQPDASFEIEDVCIPNQPPISLQPNAYSKDVWYLNGKLFTTDSIPNFQSTRAGDYVLKHSSVSTVGCGTSEVEQNFSLQQAIARAGRDSLVIANTPFQLNGFANGSVQWSPSIGLSDPTVAQPTSSITATQTYAMNVTTSAGCTATDTVRFMVFKDASIYVPNAFTPNGDGRNDIFLPGYVGIKKLQYLSIYNRWGGLVFNTNNLGKGWNGIDKDSQLGVGTYIWIINAEDINGQNIQMKGSVTIVR
jgi:gliding motility-associated-like protein